MPKHIAVGVNSQSGSIEFKGVKTSTITFVKAFLKVPLITISLSDTGTSFVPYKMNASKTGFKVMFQQAYTGTVDWTAIERDE